MAQSWRGSNSGVTYDSALRGSHSTTTHSSACVGRVLFSRSRITAKERDTETGLDYFGARYYGSNMGRFMTPDPKQLSLKHIAIPQRWNAYAYVRNNPLVFADYDGLDDFNVFITYRPGESLRNSPNWQQIQANAVKHGNKVNLFTGSRGDNAASAANLQKSLSSGQTTIVIGHTQLIDSGNGAHAAAVSMSDKEVGQPGAPGQMGAGRITNGQVVPAEMPTVSGGTVALFGCDSLSLSGQYSGANAFVGVDSAGAGQTGAALLETSVDGLAAAGSNFVNTLASGGTLPAAVNSANANINQDRALDRGDKVKQCDQSGCR